MEKLKHHKHILRAEAEGGIFFLLEWQACNESVFACWKRKKLKIGEKKSYLRKTS